MQEFSAADKRYMRRALALARRGGRAVCPNPQVGAVLVQGHQIVGKGWHRQVGAPHAEVEAIRDAREFARGATLYVTLEPCNHQGRTGPCSEAVLEAGISRVVIAMRDPNSEVPGGGADRLREAGVVVETACLESEARELNRAWLAWLTNKKPLVDGLLSLSLSGRVLTEQTVCSSYQTSLARLRKKFVTQADAEFHSESLNEEIFQYLMATNISDIVQAREVGQFGRLCVIHVPQFERGELLEAIPSFKFQLLQTKKIFGFAVSLYLLD